MDPVMKKNRTIKTMSRDNKKLGERVYLWKKNNNKEYFLGILASDQKLHR